MIGSRRQGKKIKNEAKNKLQKTKDLYFNQAA